MFLGLSDAVYRLRSYLQPVSLDPFLKDLITPHFSPAIRTCIFGNKVQSDAHRNKHSCNSVMQLTEAAIREEALKS